MKIQYLCSLVIFPVCNFGKLDKILTFLLHSDTATLFFIPTNTTASDSLLDHDTIAGSPRHWSHITAWQPRAEPSRPWQTESDQVFHGSAQQPDTSVASTPTVLYFLQTTNTTRNLQLFHIFSGLVKSFILCRSSDHLQHLLTFWH